MTMRKVISSLALVSAMTLSGGVMAQSMIGDFEIPAENMADFQAKCAAIASVQNESLAGSVDETETGSVTDPALSQDDGDPASEDNIDALLASMTPDQCREAGLLDGQVPATSN